MPQQMNSIIQTTLTAMVQLAKDITHIHSLNTSYISFFIIKKKTFAVFDSLTSVTGH
jgi:hypothetical protein